MVWEWGGSWNMLCRLWGVRPLKMKHEMHRWGHTPSHVGSPNIFGNFVGVTFLRLFVEGSVGIFMLLVIQGVPVGGPQWTDSACFVLHCSFRPGRSEQAEFNVVNGLSHDCIGTIKFHSLGFISFPFVWGYLLLGGGHMPSLSASVNGCACQAIFHYQYSNAVEQGGQQVGLTMTSCYLRVRKTFWEPSVYFPKCCKGRGRPMNKKYNMMGFLTLSEHDLDNSWFN